MRDETDPRAVEPRAEIREGARAIREVYAALRAEGFTEQQALVIVGQMLAGSAGAR